MDVIEATNITYTYPNSDRGIPSPGISFTASSGQITAVVGTSGSGKSTLLACLAGVLTPTSGEIRIDGRTVTSSDTESTSPTRMLVLQSCALFERLPLWQNVALAWGWPGRGLRRRAEEHLDMLGLRELTDQLPSGLSLGQRQRAAIACAVACDPRVLLADEPTGSLDPANRERVIQLIREVAAQDRVVIVATHDENAIGFADTVLTLGRMGPQ